MPITRLEPPANPITVYCTASTSVLGTWNANCPGLGVISTNSTNVSADIITALTAAHVDDNTLLIVWSPSSNMICRSPFSDFKAGALVAPH
jgi:hypothetical protein